MYALYSFKAAYLKVVIQQSWNLELEMQGSEWVSKQQRGSFRYIVVAYKSAQT